MDEKDIVNSPVFKAINILIDRKARNLKNSIAAVPESIKTAYNTAYPDCIDTRVSYESEDGRSRDGIELGVNIHSLNDTVAWLLREIMDVQKEINELMRFKLELLNDYDFTHGDNSLQIEVFGEAVNE